MGAPNSPKRPAAWAVKLDWKELQNRYAALFDQVNLIAYRTILFRDMLEETLKTLHQAGRLNPQQSQLLQIQISTVDNIINQCMFIPPAKVAQFRSERATDPKAEGDFRKSVDKMVRSVSPLIIFPGNKARGGGRLVIN
jgi:hypothetical protein